VDNLVIHVFILIKNGGFLEMDEKKYFYDVDGLFQLMEPFKTSTNDIKSFDKKTNNRSACLFISIYRGYPKTQIRVDLCKEKNHQGDLISISDLIYRSSILGLYKYCNETIDIIQKWQKGHNLILKIDKELIKMDIENIEKVKELIEMDIKNID
jgi:hypothetical protein